MIRTLRFEVQRYGPYSTAAESVYDRPFQWGSKRTGPDLARIGGKYSDEWQRQHLLKPRDLVPESNMPDYPWLAERPVDGRDIEARIRVLRLLGDPYTDADIDNARDAVAGKSELDALVAYLQGLGTTSPGQQPQAAVDGGGRQRRRTMNGLWGQVAGVVTIVLLIVFVAIWVWAWRPRHARRFDELARIPMLDANVSASGDEPRR